MNDNFIIMYLIYFKTKLTNILSIQFNWFITKINLKMGCTATKETNKKTRENKLSLPDEHHD